MTSQTTTADDLCECGDFRSQHVGGRGPCQFNPARGSRHYAHCWGHNIPGDGNYCMRFTKVVV